MCLRADLTTCTFGTSCQSRQIVVCFFLERQLQSIGSDKKDELKTHDLGFCKEGKKMLGTVLLVILILILLGALPTWPHSRNWGYAPSGGLGLIVLILVILLLLGRI